MDRAIRALLNNRILEESAGKFGFHPDDLTDLGGFQNFVYGAHRDAKHCVIRIAHSSHRSLAMTEAELNWISYLMNHGVRAAAPIRSIEGKWAARINSGEDYFVATAFESAPGAKLDYRIYTEDSQWVRRLGRMIGRIHALTKAYRVQEGSPRRCDWYENHYLTRISSYVPASYEHVLEPIQRFLGEIRLLPQDPDSYGLIHGDIQLGNFHAHQDGLTLFDFDECEYNWLAADIANPLFYATPLKSDGVELRNATAQRFYDNLMEGYCRENTLETYWLERIPLFLRLREILVYSGAFRSLDLNNLHPWSKEMLDTTTSNLMNDLPYLAIRFK
ncbi:phosphotransferase enzyme family protein [Paenibacillus spongiae]|uniref:Phosphotransferase n=1 Tax=Paenibacillus spongiae TaxID=2909671 RepID=A0ABY5S6A4_9BACL|nr:phosphotransferase [Paenibacillus spongiae]UVI29189.1 phosphotransferase [Paenibacillus spongiae]